MATQRDKENNNPKAIQGNPRALNDTKIKKICHLIRCGNYVKPSVKACDVNYHTFLDCMRKGKQGITPYEDWYFMVEQAKAEAEVGMSLRIHESAEAGNVGADMFKLQRMFPQRWASTKRVEAKIDNSQEITIRKYSEMNEDKKD